MLAFLYDLFIIRFLCVFDWLLNTATSLLLLLRTIRQHLPLLLVGLQCVHTMEKGCSSWSFFHFFLLVRACSWVCGCLWVCVCLIVCVCLCAFWGFFYARSLCCLSVAAISLPLFIHILIFQSVAFLLFFFSCCVWCIGVLCECVCGVFLCAWVYGDDCIGCCISWFSVTSLRELGFRYPEYSCPALSWGTSSFGRR